VVRRGLKMRCELQEQVSISFDIPKLQPHLVCDERFCIDKGEEICMSSEFKEYLQSNFKVDQDFKKNFYNYQKNDLLWYLTKDLKIKNFLASSVGHRLRYKEHDKKACQFIDNVFDFYNTIFVRGNLLEDGKPFINSFNDEKRKNQAVVPYHQIWKEDNLWGENLKNSLYNYKIYFTNLCELARKRSVGEIYRLFDLANRYDENHIIGLTDFLALLYAMGHKNKKKPESISEFVSYYEFFREYIKNCKTMYRELAKKTSTFNSTNNGILDAYLHLISSEGIKKANDVWCTYYEAIKNLFGGTLYFEESTDSQFVDSLRSHLRRTPSSFSLPFSSLDSATYHAFKHKDICTVPAEELPVCSYVELTREVILNGNLSTSAPPRPDQFGKGRIYTFEKQLNIRGRSKIVRVFLLKGRDRNTFILSTF
jgi:hypothetical protein